MIIDSLPTWNAKSEINNFLKSVNKLAKDKIVVALICQEKEKIMSEKPRLYDYRFYKKNIKNQFNKIYSLYRTDNVGHSTNIKLYDIKNKCPMLNYVENLIDTSLLK